jgi:hypothetical protein
MPGRQHEAQLRRRSHQEQPQLAKRLEGIEYRDPESLRIALFGVRRYPGGAVRVTSQIDPRPQHERLPAPRGRRDLGHSARPVELFEQRTAMYHPTLDGGDDSTDSHRSVIARHQTHFTHYGWSPTRRA